MPESHAPSNKPVPALFFSSAALLLLAMITTPSNAAAIMFFLLTVFVGSIVHICIESLMRNSASINLSLPFAAIKKVLPILAVLFSMIIASHLLRCRFENLTELTSTVHETSELCRLIVATVIIHRAML